MEKVSIIIPFYNCPFIDQAIQSALNQTYQNVEVIVVNDGSTSHTSRISPFLSKIKYIEKGHAGTASALNAGIAHATGEYFAWLSSDDVFLPGKIQKQLAHMKINRTKVSHTAYKLIDGKGQNIGSPIQFHFANKQSFYKTLLKQCPVNGSTVMTHMDVFQKVGLFDESLRFTQDYDMWLRLAKIYDFTYLKWPLIQYRVHTGMGSFKYASGLRKETMKVMDRHRKDIKQLIIRERKKKWTNH